VKYLGLICVAGAGFLAGWFAHAWSTEEPADRTGPRDRTATERRRAAPVEPPADDPAPAREPEAAATPDEAGETVAQPAEGETEVEGDPLAEWMESVSPQWKAWGSMQAKQKIGALLAKMGFDPETAKLIEEAMAKDAELQIDKAIRMMLGEEAMDPDAFYYFMGVPPELSEELERELATFLGDEDILAIRTQVKREHEQQVEAMVDMQIGMMAIPDLSDNQKTRIREALAGRDMMQEQMRQFAEVTRDRTKLARLLKGEGLNEAMEENFAPMRKKMRTILSPQQFESYLAYEKRTVKMVEGQMKMLAGMFKKEPAPPK